MLVVYTKQGNLTRRFNALFVWLVSHQPAVFFSQNKRNQLPPTNKQYFSLKTNQHQPLATSQTNRLQASFTELLLASDKKTVATLFTGADFLSPLSFSLSQPKEEPQILAPPIPGSLPL
jgi:multidrug efflux pump subunit AcrB